MNQSENINELATAMSKAQAAMKPATKDSTNPFHKNNYSNITSIWESARIPVTSNGLTVWQDVTTSEKSVSVTTKIVHSSGQWVEFGPLTIPIAKFDAQGIGSATTYAKRYALCGALGIVSDDDDDGEAACMPMRKEEYKPQAKPEVKSTAKISVSQIKEINELLEICSSEYVEKFLGFLQQKYGSRALDSIPTSDFEGVIRYITQAMKMNAEVAK
jgi:hypothetical protein